MKAAVRNHDAESPLMTYDEMVRREGVYASDDPHDTTMRVIVLHNEGGDMVALYVSDGILQPLDDGWKTNKFRKVHESLTIII